MIQIREHNIKPTKDIFFLMFRPILYYCANQLNNVLSVLIELKTEQQ